MKSGKNQKIFFYFNITKNIIFNYRNLIFDTENVESWNSTFKRSAKGLCDFLKDIYTLSEFFITRTIHIANKQVKTFHL